MRSYRALVVNLFGLWRHRYYYDIIVMLDLNTDNKSLGS